MARDGFFDAGQSAPRGERRVLPVVNGFWGRVGQFIAMMAMVVTAVWVLKGEVGDVKLDIQQLRSDLEMMTMDRFSCTQAVIWAGQIKVGNPSMEVPEVPCIPEPYLQRAGG